MTMHPAIRSGLLILFGTMVLVSASTAEENDKTYVFECSSGSEFVLDISAKGVWLFRDTRTLELAKPRGLVAYTASGIELTINQDEAILREAGQITQLCQNNHKRAIWEHAKLRGTDFRAVGNEPGWSLEFIAGSQIIFTSDYNTVQIERPLPEPVTDNKTRSTRWDTGDLLITVIGEPCQDSMSDDTYESTVQVSWQGRNYDGCGKALH